MIARLVIASLLAILMVGLGISIQFTEPRDEIEMDMFLEIESTVPGLEFDLGRLHSEPPILLPVHDSDPGLIVGQYPGLILGVELEEVDPEVFFQPELLLSTLLPGWRPVARWREGVGRLPIGRSMLFWVGSIARARDLEGVERSVLVFGIGADDVEDRFPRWLQGTRAIAIPFEMPEGQETIAARFDGRVIFAEGPLDRFERFAERVVVSITPATD